MILYNTPPGYRDRTIEEGIDTYFKKKPLNIDL